MERLKAIGERLKTYMQHKRFTINKMALATGIPAAKIANIIDGKRYPISKLLLVAEALPDLNHRWLLQGEGDMLKNHKLNTTPEKLKYLNSKTDTVQSLKTEITELTNRLNKLEKEFTRQTELIKTNNKNVSLI